MSKFYKLHKWISLISILFFLMFCVTGLILMFRSELNTWAQGGTDQSESTMMNVVMHESIFDYSDAGALLINQKYPSKDILNISPVMGGQHLLRYRIIESTNNVAPRARMGMGGDYLLYNPQSNSLITAHRNSDTHPWVKSTLHVLHQLHTRLDLGAIGIYIVSILSLLCFISIITGIFLYGPFSIGYMKASYTTFRMRLSHIHREFSMMAAVWGLILSITGVWVGGFFIANNYYNNQVETLAKQELSVNKSEILKPSEAINRILNAYPNHKLISLDYPSKFNGSHYVFYLGEQEDEDPAMFLGQPVYANLYSDSSKDQFVTETIPWYFTGMTTMINLHIHNHQSMMLKILWAIWDIVLIVGIVTGLMLICRKKYKGSTTVKSKVSSNITHVWYKPIMCSILIILGLIVPLWHNTVTTIIGTICLTIPLLVLLYSFVKLHRS